MGIRKFNTDEELPRATFGTPDKKLKIGDVFDIIKENRKKLT